MGGWTNDSMDSLTIPSTAGDADPRVFIGQHDPILDMLGQDAGVLFYLGSGSALVESVSSAEGGAEGQWAMTVVASGGRILARPIRLFINGTTEQVAMELGNGADVLNWGRSLGRGVLGRASRVTNSGGITAETVIVATSALAFAPGRAYRVDVIGGAFGSTAGNLARFRLRKTNATGALLHELLSVRTEAGDPISVNIADELINPGAASVVASIAVTVHMVAGAGTVSTYGEVRRPFRLRVTDIGSADDYPDAPVIS